MLLCVLFNEESFQQSHVMSLSWNIYLHWTTIYLMSTLIWLSKISFPYWTSHTCPHDTLMHTIAAASGRERTSFLHLKIIKHEPDPTWCCVQQYYPDQIPDLKLCQVTSGSGQVPELSVACVATTESKVGHPIMWYIGHSQFSSMVRCCFQSLAQVDQQAQTP